MQQQKSDRRSRNWCFIAYPDSVPENWQNILADQHIPLAISPLHDSDLTADGEEKKPHWHIFLKFDSMKSYDQVLEITKLINATIPKIVISARGMIRYFVHLDHPDKAQYKIDDIKLINGFDISPFATQTVKERHSIIAEMLDYIDLHCVVEVKDFVNYARVVHYEDWFPVICGSSFRIIESYIRSARNVYWRDQKYRDVKAYGFVEETENKKE